MSSHHRIFVVEVMGRHCGELASYAGLASGADCVITKDNFVDYNTCVEQIREVKERRGKRQLLIVCQENVLDVANLRPYPRKLLASSPAMRCLDISNVGASLPPMIVYWERYWAKRQQPSS